MKVKELNDKRFELMQKHDKILKRKAEHKALANKGIKFLIEMEMGNAPPKEFLLKNIDINPEEYRVQRNLDEMIDRGYHYVSNTRDKIDDIRR